MENYLTTAAKLQAESVSRVTNTAKKAAQLAVSPPRPDTLTESWDLAEATYRRVNALQASWVRDWADWMGYAKSLEGANTMPKYVERTGNIMLQAQAQIASQANELSELMDNVSVSYAYWLDQQVTRGRSD